MVGSLRLLEGSGVGGWSAHMSLQRTSAN